VLEWCWDWYGIYASRAQTDPRGVTLGSFRVSRGGAGNGNADSCRVACRYSGVPSNGGSSTLGFRVARSSVP